MKGRRIALTGGIACGKSLVAKCLNGLGIETIDADDVVHELIPDPAERRRIAAEVFADPEKRRALEARLHPLVREEINRRIVESFESSNGGRAAAQPTGLLQDNRAPQATRPLIRRIDDSDDSTISPVVIIPLLFETHWDAEYDIICCVASDRETQISRMTATRGYTREEAEARLAAQLPVAEKAAKSHYVIENNGSVEELKEKVRKFVSWLTNSTYSQER